MSGGSLTVRVARKALEAEGIASFELVSTDGSPLPAFAAGSHIDVQLPGGPTRQYSLCNDPAETHRYLIAVLRDAASRGGSAAMHEQVKVGDTLFISTPKNHFALAHEAQSHLLLAGGIGVTPLLCMAERLAHSGARFEMHYCTRSRARTAFVRRIEDSPLASRVQFHFDDGPPRSAPRSTHWSVRRAQGNTSTSAARRASWTRCWPARGRKAGPRRRSTTSSSVPGRLATARRAASR